MAAIREPADAVRFPIARNADGMRFPRAKLPEKDSRSIREGEVAAIRRNRSTDDRIIFRIAGQAALHQPNGADGAMTRAPSNGNAHEKQNGRRRANAPVKARMRNRRGFRGRSHRYPIEGRKEAISATCKSLNKPRVLCGVAKGIAQALDGGVQAMVEIDKRVRRP